MGRAVVVCVCVGGGWGNFFLAVAFEYPNIAASA